MVATFDGNSSAKIISRYSPTNVREETKLIAFYDELSSLVRSIRKYNVLVIGGDMNDQIGKNRNHIFSLHNSSNRNRQHLTDGVSSDLKIVTAKIRMSLRKNTTWTTATVHSDWVMLNNRDIRDKYAIALRNKYHALQEKTETHTPNEEYENFVNAYLEAAAECIPTKQRTKSRIPWETLVVREERADVKTASKCNQKNPTHTNALKLKKAQNELANIYLKEQLECIQNQIDKIRDSVEYRQSTIAWQTINEVSRRKRTAKVKLRATSQQDRIHLWKQHFENLLGNPPEVTHKPITKIISKQLVIKLGPFIQVEFDSILRKIKNRKAAGLDEIPPEVKKTRKFDDILLLHCKAVYNQNPINK